MKKRRDHYCWCCDRVRPNERFSGKGHARHRCRDCAKNSAADLAYRQGVRNIDRLVDRFRGVVPRRHRTAFERFLSHQDERIRAYAAGVAKADEDARREYRMLREEEERAFEAFTMEIEAEPNAERPPFEDHFPCEDDIPF